MKVKKTKKITFSQRKRVSIFSIISVIALAFTVLFVHQAQSLIQYAAGPTNILQNGDFENTGSSWLLPWYVNTQNGAAATTNQDNSNPASGRYDAHVKITKLSASPQPWDVYLAQGSLSLTQGAPVTVTFSAKTSTSHAIQVMIQQNYGSYTAYKTQSFTLSTTWKQYALTFTPTTTDSNVLLSFQLGTKTGDVWIDNVTLVTQVTPTSTPGVTARNIYNWPFSWDSIWNMPISTSAQYEKVNLAVDMSMNYGQGTYLDLEDISVDPSFPVTSVNANGQSLQVHVDPSFAGNPAINGDWNNCASFLTQDNTGIYQGEPLNYPSGGTPSYQYTWPEVSLKSTGIPGCHGGSGLSGFGGDIRKGEMTSNAPITHTLKIALDCVIYCSRKGNGGKGYTWPATSADYEYNVPGSDNYYDRSGTADQYVLMGSLVALPPTFKLSSLSSPHAKKLALALMEYGAYVDDNTASSENNPSVTKGQDALDVQQGAQTEFPDSGCPIDGQTTPPSSSCTFYTDLGTIIANLEVVKNNTSTTPGGGSIGTSRLAQYAPAFTDGTGTPPSVQVIPPSGAQQ